MVHLYWQGSLLKRQTRRHPALLERKHYGRGESWGGTECGVVGGRALPMRVCASVQASETDGMDPKGKVMTVYSGQHAG